MVGAASLTFNFGYGNNLTHTRLNEPMRQYVMPDSTSLPNQASTPNQQETDFVDALYAGQPNAWTELVDQWSPRLYNYLIYNAISEAEVQKLIHSIFSSVVRVILGSRRVANVAVLILSVAYRHVLHYRREAPLIMPTRLRQIALAADENDDRRINFFLAFYQFAPEIQQILLLHHLCEITLAELAQIVGQSEAALTPILEQAKLILQT